jgi:hypothetical protein
MAATAALGESPGINEPPALGSFGGLGGDRGTPAVPRSTAPGLTPPGAAVGLVETGGGTAGAAL